MKGHTITVTDRGTTIVLTGYKVVETAKRAGLRPIYNGVAQGWVTDAHRLPDLLAFCQSRSIPVEITATTITTVPNSTITTMENSSSTGDDETLFGGDAA